jgi:hypothetical protein
MAGSEPLDLCQACWSVAPAAAVVARLAEKSIAHEIYKARRVQQ